MSPLAILGLLGLGGVVLYETTKTASAAQPAQQASLASNPNLSALAPGFQGQVAPGQSAYLPSEPAQPADWYDPATGTYTSTIATPGSDAALYPPGTPSVSAFYDPLSGRYY